MEKTVKTEIETIFDDNGYVPGLYSKDDDLYLYSDANKDEIKDFALAVGCSEKLVKVLLHLGMNIKDNDEYLNEDIKDLGRIVLE